ncbi:hypothetical protein GCM10023193_44650 [Planotetraspora kaengkrachanensis]|uniref:Uncharacterized protein n=1 Tax=Planotetraspora kaengkrachanensis TaxID=575193 RepID=A0A8J3V9H5_9ACTN|nr:hypothetical protein Pka01_64920 [Planotetraspora kaengkrachanensis]
MQWSAINPPTIATIQHRHPKLPRADSQRDDPGNRCRGTQQIHSLTIEPQLGSAYPSRPAATAQM